MNYLLTDQSVAEKIIAFDKLLTYYLAGLFPKSWQFREIFSFLSLTGGYLSVWVILIVFILIRKKGKRLTLILLFAGSLILTLFSVHYLFKPLVKRERPPPVAPLVCPTNYSLPSGHAAVAFASATIIAFGDKKRKYWYYTTALLIAYSRIYLGCHFFFDVVFGAFYGYFIARSLIYLISYKKILFRSKKN